MIMIFSYGFLARRMRTQILFIPRNEETFVGNRTCSTATDVEFRQKSICSCCKSNFWKRNIWRYSDRLCHTHSLSRQVDPLVKCSRPKKSFRISIGEVSTSDRRWTSTKHFFSCFSEEEKGKENLSMSYFFSRCLIISWWQNAFIWWTKEQKNVRALSLR